MIFPKLNLLIFSSGSVKKNIHVKLLQKLLKKEVFRELQQLHNWPKLLPASARRDGHPARKCFQAIRIAVNGELDHLNNVLDTAFGLLNKEGVLAIITFHSLEDRMVKQRFKEYCTGCTCPPDFPVCVCGKTPRGHLLTRKPIEPSKEELEVNPRSRSAKLRVIVKN